MRFGLQFLFILVPGLSHLLEGQPLSKEKREEILMLLDSAQYYELTSPSRNLEYVNLILEQVPTTGNEEICATALLMASNSLKMMSRKEEALAHATQARALSDKLENPEFRIRADFMKASIFGQDDHHDSALVYYQRVIEQHEPRVSAYYISGAYTNVGSIYSSIGNVQKAEEYFLKGYQLSAVDDYAKTFALSSIISFYVAHDNPKYLPYLDTLAESDFYKKSSDASFMAHFEYFLLLDEASEAEKEETLREIYTYSQNHSSLANQTGYGMKLYEHLFQQGRYKEGFPILKEVLQKAYQANNANDVATIHQHLYENAKLRGNLGEALLYLERYSDIRDSLLSKENINQIAELNIQFETAQKDHEISLQKSKLEQAKRNRNFFIALTSSLALLAIVVFYYFRNRARSAHRIAEQEKIIRRQDAERLEKERELAELSVMMETQEKERNRIARDLHDGVGSMMSGISSQVEYLKSQPIIMQSAGVHLHQLRDMIKEASTELRRTSYELMPAKLLRQGLEPAIRDLCMNLLVKNGIDPSLEVNTDLSELDAEQQLTLYRIIQELLNNIVKHAGAKKAFIQFNKFGEEFSLVVEDDGKGFDVEDRKKDGGLGLGSLSSRVILLQGFLDIASIPGEGTTVTVNFKAPNTNLQTKDNGLANS